MEIVNFYVPSEAQILLNPDTSAVSVINYQFHILKEEDKLYLQIFFESYTDTEEISEPICKQICDLADQHRLTNAAVNRMLLPLKMQLMQKMPELENQTFINISRLFTSAKGYISKEGNPIAIFTANALYPDVFNNKYSICFTLPIGNTDKIVLLSSKEHLLRDQQSVLFTFLAYDHIYQAAAFPKNGVFYLQQISQVSSMQHHELFTADCPLSDIYRRFMGKKNRLGVLFNKVAQQ
jgi:hypothetical protein